MHPFEFDSHWLSVNSESRGAFESIKIGFPILFLQQALEYAQCSRLIEIDRLIDNNSLFGSSFVFYVCVILLVFICVRFIWKKTSEQNVYNVENKKKYRFTLKIDVPCAVLCSVNPFGMLFAFSSDIIYQRATTNVAIKNVAIALQWKKLKYLKSNCKIFSVTLPVFPFTFQCRTF